MRKFVRVILVTFIFVLMTTLSLKAIGQDIPAKKNISGEKIEKWDFILYLPDTLETGHRYPIITAFSPAADAEGLLQTWKEHARNHQCALFCSKVIRNDLDVAPILNRMSKQIFELAQDYPIDPARIIGTGVSGGGMAAHLFAFLHPAQVVAVISNVGYIHEDCIKKEKRYPRRKICAFLTSPTDFNYKLMKEDKQLLDRLEWQTRWWEFEGGHRQAPDKINEEALAWVMEHLPPASSSPTAPASIDEPSLATPAGTTLH
ncbi:MAG: hypothetical protein HQM08_06890 [Candidatus Riflebacteria bacterium]|nr:hypothetical protein [Candidatus Riflebacteria bacterium]